MLCESQRSLDPTLGKRQECATTLCRSALLWVNVAGSLFAVNDDVSALRGNKERRDAERVPPPGNRRVQLKRLVEIAPDQCDGVLVRLKCHLSFLHGFPGLAERPLAGVVELRLYCRKGALRNRAVQNRHNLLGKELVQLSVVDKRNAQVAGRFSVTRSDIADMSRPDRAPDNAPIADGSENYAVFFIEQANARVFAGDVNLSQLDAILNSAALCPRKARCDQNQSRAQPGQPKLFHSSLPPNNRIRHAARPGSRRLRYHGERAARDSGNGGGSV